MLTNGSKENIENIFRMIQKLQPNLVDQESNKGKTLRIHERNKSSA